MRKYGNLFALCCLVLSGFACDSKDRAPKPATAGTNESCTPAIYYGCSASCDPGVKAWKKCNDNGASYGECLCANPAPVSSPDASVPASSPDAAVVTPLAPAPDAAASTGPTTIQVNVDINYPPPPDAGAAPAPSPTPTPPPVQKTCQNGNDFVSVGSMRPCGFVAGACRPGTQICNDSGWSECAGGTLPTAEVCDGVDNDCDGAIDDGLICECDPNQPSRDCGSNIGMCRFGQQYCVKVGDGYRWSTDCVNEIKPRQEHCDNLDWDCNSVPHNGFNLQNDPLNCGTCGNSCQRANAIGSCVAGVCKFSCQVGFYDLNGKSEDGCEYMCPYTKPLAAEIANGLDDNCNGVVDEGFNFDTDPLNCGKPGRKCQFANASASCVDGDCRLNACSVGFVDKDKDPWNGCEYSCTKTANAEVCGNKLDDNCDGEVDEGCDCDPADTTPVLCGNNTGTCKSQKTCQTNGKYGACTVMVGPKAKSCDAVNHLDLDCNGLADDSEFDLTKDVMNCGACGSVCSFPNAQALCVNGACQMGTCSLAYHDLDKDSKNGCEYGPILPTNGGIEQCDGIDNDVNGKIDDGPATCACTLINSSRDCGPALVGECRPGVQTCKAPGQWSTCDLTRAVSPVKEICNDKDDDCDGVIDNGFDLQTDPLNCGACNVRCPFVNATASCVAGKCAIAKCNPYFYDLNGKPEDGCEFGPCIKEGPEVCDGRDNDCNGVIDDVAGGCGCMVGSTQTCGKNVGECHAGNQACLGPAPGHWGPCQNEQFAVPEICNNRDDDCDGKVDNGFDLTSDVKNCGACGTVCKFANATASCVQGACQMGACETNWYDFNKNVADGCEAPCVKTNGGVEQCDKIDNNCDGTVDEGFNTQTDLLNCGACGHACNLPNAVPVCTAGVCAISSCKPGYWDLDKDPNDGCEHACIPTNNGVEICDGLDNDCNGTPDDGIFCNCKTTESPRECGTGIGMCQTGTQSCINGVWQACTGMVDPRPIICDANTDMNCNGIPDGVEWNVKDDKLNCGGCGIVCSFPHADASCINGVCLMGACNANYFDFDKSAADGCETGCMPTRNGVEYCDGIDNNCDGIVDNATVAVQTDPMNCGACGHVCTLPNVAENGCGSGACTIVHCLPGYADTNGLASDGCETKLAPPDGGTD